MAESALEKLMRLKRERAGEASAVGGADLSPSKPTSESSETPSIKEESKDGSGVLVNPASDLSSFSSDRNVPSEVEVKEESKPMSAMERLRAIKLGGTGGSDEAKVSDSSAIVRSDPVVISDPVKAVLNAGGYDLARLAVAAKVVEQEKKERKTHPLAMEMAELEAALDAEVPGFVNILSQIHKKLKADPECVTLLDDEEIGRIVAGLEKHTNVTIVSPNAVKAAKKASKVPVTAADL